MDSRYPGPTSFPLAEMPIDSVMPSAVQGAMIAVLAVMLAGVLVHAIILARRDGDNRLLVLLGCGAAASLLEGFACHLIHCYHSRIGNIEVYEAFDIHVPLWLAELYVLFFGAMPYYFLRRCAKAFSAKYYWCCFIGIGISEGIGEMIAIKLGMHTYYGVQPIAIFGFPLYLGFVNPACAVGFSLIAAAWFHRVQGAARYWLIPLTPPIFAGVYGAFVFPTAPFLYSGDSRMVLGSIATMVLTVVAGTFVYRALPTYLGDYRTMAEVKREVLVRDSA